MKFPPKIFTLFFAPYVFVSKIFENTVFTSEQRRLFHKYLINNSIYVIPKEEFDKDVSINHEEVTLCIKAYKVFRHHRGTEFIIDIENNPKLYPHFAKIAQFITKFLENKAIKKDRINVYLDYFRAIYIEHEKMNNVPRLYQLATDFAFNAFLTWVEENYPQGSYFQI